jgi:hypothetical protein
MNRFVAISILMFSIGGFAQTPHMGRGARVYIEPKNDFERILTASLYKEKVPVIIVKEKTKPITLSKVRSVKTQEEYCQVLAHLLL